MAQRIRYEYRRPGRPTTHYDEWLVLDRPDLKVLLLERYEGPEVSVAGRSVLEAGAPHRLVHEPVPAGTAGGGPLGRQRPVPGPVAAGGGGAPVAR
jgi:hypothetical protein